MNRPIPGQAPGLLVVVRCGAKGCGRALAKVERIGPILSGDPIALLISSSAIGGGYRTEAAVPADYSGELKIAVCPRHYQRVDPEDGTVVRARAPEPGTTIPRLAGIWTGTMSADLLREPIERAQRTGATQQLRVT
ncbi:hypothetical protein J2S43_007521 [Catenuloplanes nepalensis]|uniref:Uncharacterized protein n=1 Tax=Catenuloplanes nepalensis TaxID=587533 RepID=A0ABT9N5R7_9ACTN|nr:hypothetical protein [Catenuloplanes nepalensis]MDP9799009.1 hypothetical protein [Catenuloplanes nepalensis]